MPKTEKANRTVLLRVNCFARNVPALRVYQRCGFELTPEREPAKDLPDEELAWLEWFGFGPV